jgi:hypothetical protein
MPDREHGISGLETDEDDKKLESLGYVPSFKREFSNLATVRDISIFSSLSHGWLHFAQISFAFSIMVRTPMSAL